MAQPTTPGVPPDQPADGTLRSGADAQEESVRPLADGSRAEADARTDRFARPADGTTDPSAADTEQARDADGGVGRADEARHAEAAHADAGETRHADAERRAVPAPPAEQPTAEPAALPAEPPKRAGNRVVGTMWVLLASGVFEAVYLALLALVVLVLAGPQVVGPQLAYFASQSSLLWLPVVFFFLLFELTVLIFNRAGRFLYIVASLIVGVAVYLLTVYLIAVVPNGAGDVALLRQSLVSPFFIVAGLAAREVMLWSGIAVGSRGIRVRRRNRAAKQRYEQELADARG